MTELWTGNASDGIKSVHEPSAQARFGHKDLSESHFGRTSHGMLSFAFTKAAGLTQYMRAKVGVDDERVRHILQNKIIHDMPFIPSALVPHQNLHVPMLDKEGRPYLNPETQELRETRAVWQLQLNPSQFY